MFSILWIFRGIDHELHYIFNTRPRQQVKEQKRKAKGEVAQCGTLLIMQRRPMHKAGAFFVIFLVVPFWQSAPTPEEFGLISSLAPPGLSKGWPLGGISSAMAWSIRPPF